MAQLDDPPELDPLRIVPTVFTANGDEIPSTVGQRVEDKLLLPREIGVTIPSGMRDLVRKLRTTNDEHNRIETTEIPGWWLKQRDKISEYFEEIQDAVNALYGLIGAPDFYPIVGVSYFGGCAASHAVIEEDLNWFCENRWKHIRVGAAWRASSGGGVINADGTINEANLATTRYLLSLATNLHMSVDLSIFATELESQGALEQGLESLGRELADFRYAFVDVCNEHSGPAGPIGSDSLKAACDALVAGDAARAFTASTSGSIGGQVDTYVSDYNAGCRFTFLTPHFERNPTWDVDLTSRLFEFAAGMADAGIALNVHAQEETRYGIPSDAVTQDANFFAAIEGARKGGAIGVNFHSEAGYDLRTTPFKNQCNPTETAVIEGGVEYWVDP